MTALNGCNEGKWQLGLVQSCPSTGEKEALTVGLPIGYLGEGRVSLIPYCRDLNVSTMTF